MLLPPSKEQHDVLDAVLWVGKRLAPLQQHLPVPWLVACASFLCFVAGFHMCLAWPRLLRMTSEAQGTAWLDRVRRVHPLGLDEWFGLSGRWLPIHCCMVCVELAHAPCRFKLGRLWHGRFIC